MIYISHKNIYLYIESSSYISPVVRYDRIIKKNEKDSSSSLDESGFLQIMKKRKADRGFIEGRHRRSYSSIKTQQILYYTFPGIIVTDENKVLQQAETFTHDDPSIFLRHDLNWIFSDKLRMKKKFEKYIKDNTVQDDESYDDNIFSPLSNESDPYFNIQDVVPKMDMTMNKVCDQSIVQNKSFIGKAQLIQDWANLKKQQCNQLCEEICELIMDIEPEDDDDTKDDDSKCGDDDDDEEEDEEFECNKIASQLLFELTIKCRDGMKLKMEANALGNKDYTSYLNMSALYKYFTLNTRNINSYQEKIDFKHRIVKQIVDSIFDAVIKNDKDKKYKKYDFLLNDDKLKQKLHEYIARCCELICSVLHHEWDLCPINLSGNKSLIEFDDRIHINDTEFSMEDSKKIIAYCSFPGIITKSCWNQFDSQIDKKQINDQQIEKFLKYKMWTSLNDNNQQK